MSSHPLYQPGANIPQTGYFWGYFLGVILLFWVYFISVFFRVLSCVFFYHFFISSFGYFLGVLFHCTFFVIFYFSYFIRYFIGYFLVVTGGPFWFQFVSLALIGDFLSLLDLCHPVNFHHWGCLTSELVSPWYLCNRS